MVELTRKYGFSASHRLHSELFSEDENTTLFGKCNNPYGHGHNYELFVTARGEVDGETGRVLDPEALDGLVRHHVLDAYQHKNMNTDIPEFQAAIPTTENVARAIAARLAENWTAAFPSGVPSLSKIRIRETDRNVFELIL